MITMSIWLLVSIGVSTPVTLIEKFPSKEECQITQKQINDQLPKGSKVYCVSATIDK